MNLQNKKYINLLLLLIFTYLLITWILKQLDYPIIDYEYNGLYNLINERDIDTLTYSVKLPFFTWKIKDTTDKAIDIRGLRIEDKFLQASFRKIGLYSSLENINKICLDKNNSIVKQNHNNPDVYNIYCYNNSDKKLKPYRIYWVKNKVFLFMHDYNFNYEEEYDSLISNIKIK